VVKIGGGGGQTTQSIAEDRERFSRHDASNIAPVDLAQAAIDDSRVQFELTRYLSDNWVPVIAWPPEHLLTACDRPIQY
jgi:hypothetical protein